MDRATCVLLAVVCAFSVSALGLESIPMLNVALIVSSPITAHDDAQSLNYRSCVCVDGGLLVVVCALMVIVLGALPLAGFLCGHYTKTMSDEYAPFKNKDQYLAFVCLCRDIENKGEFDGVLKGSFDRKLGELKDIPDGANCRVKDSVIHSVT